MALNLIDQLKSEFSDSAISSVASFLGDSSEKTRGALGYAIPAVLGGLLQKSQTTQGANDLVGMLTRAGADATSFKGLTSLLSQGGGLADLVKTGAPLLASLFGARQSGVIDAIAGASGLGKQSAGSLLALAAPFISSMVGKEASAAGGFNAASLTRLLSGQAGNIAAVAPAGLSQLLGISSWGEVPRVAAAPAPPRVDVPRPQADGGFGWLKWALPLLLIPLLIWWLSSGRTQGPAAPTGVGVSTPAPTTGAVPPLAASAAALVKRMLPSGQALDVAENGVEAKLIAFIDDKTRAVDETTWFSFDRLEFETGSANLRPASLQQVQNIAAIMKAYPTVTLKMGGYTDNVGSPASNVTLSQARADATMRAIVAEGIAATRLSAEGYGDRFPVASNDTEEGRQRNRRIDVRVTAR